MDGGAAQISTSATTAGSVTAIGGPASGRRDTDINYPLQAGVPPNVPDRGILAGSGVDRHRFIEISKY
jgi:hypothetical protein